MLPPTSVKIVLLSGLLLTWLTSKHKDIFPDVQFITHRMWSTAKCVVFFLLPPSITTWTRDYTDLKISIFNGDWTPDSELILKDNLTAFWDSKFSMM